MIKPTDLKKFIRKEGPSEDTSIPLRRGNKIIIGGRGKKERSWRRGRVRCKVRQERSPEGQENEWKYAHTGVGVIIESPRDLGYKRLP